MIKNLPADAGDARDSGSGRSLGQEDPLEDGMETHPTTLPWEIPWTEEPAGF